MLSPDELAQRLPPVGEAALFLDFDGTLVDIAETPTGIAIPDDLSDLLAALSERLDGALALVSGRSVAMIEDFVPAYSGDIAGGHGAERRESGRLHQHAFAGSRALAEITTSVQDFASRHDGLIAEEKPTGVVLHYRRAPQLEEAALAHMHSLAAAHDGIELHRAKMAAELRPDDTGKDRAVSEMMARQPYADRRAVFFGDDATDEPAMRFCVVHGGTACKIGDGESAAPLRIGSPPELRAALSRWMRL